MPWNYASCHKLHANPSQSCPSLSHLTPLATDLRDYPPRRQHLQLRQRRMQHLAKQLPRPIHPTSPHTNPAPQCCPPSSPAHELAPNISDLFSSKAHRRRRASFPNVNGANPTDNDNDEPLYTASQVQSFLDWREKQHSSSPSNVPSVSQLVSIAAVLFVLVAQFLIPWFQEQNSRSEDIRRAQFEAVCPWSPFEDHWICASDLVKARSAGARSKSRNTFEKPVVRNMALARAAQEVVAEFEYSGDEIRNGVKEFLKEMSRYSSSLVSRRSQCASMAIGTLKSYTDILDHR
jgi:hypothetical protein